MPFFSTAQRSPVAGTATRGLRELMAQREATRQYNLERQDRMDMLIAKKQEEARLRALSTSLLGIKNFNQENLTAWAVANNVSSDDLSALAPAIKQREQKEEWVDIETPTQTGQKNLKTGKKVLTDKPDPIRTYVDEEDENFVWQRESGTDKIIGRTRKPEGDDGSGSGSGRGKLDKVADWYLKTKAEVEKAYYGDNLEPTENQRQNFDRAMLRAETLIMDTANEFNIPHEAAVPYAMSQIRQEKVWATDAERNLPEVNRGITPATRSNDETVDAVREMKRNGMPIRVIGEALKNKGWTDLEVTEMLDTAANLISAREAGFNEAKLRSTAIGEGQSVRSPDGTLWTRRGEYLISDDGRKVRK